MSVYWIFLVALLIAWQNNVTDAKGTSFAVAFPPTMSGSDEGYCKVYVNSENLGTVWVSANGITTDITLWPELTRVFPFSPADFRTTAGVENKAIYVYSDVEMTVTVTNARTDLLMDSALALPLNAGPENRYFILSHPTSSGESLCLEGTPASTYTVVATEDNTQLTIYRYTAEGPGLIDTVMLNRGQTYTNSTLKTADVSTQTFDFTGYYIEADKAISVSAGNPCTDPVSGRGPAPIWSTMPAVWNAGVRYMSHPLTYPGGSGDSYLVRTLALTDQTTVTYRRAGDSTELSAGTYHDLLVDDNREVEIIECSQPCMVAQYSHFHAESAIFMTILPAVSNYASDVVFNYADQGTTELGTFLSIIYDTEDPTESPLLLNNVDISGNNWVLHPLGFSYLEIDMGSNTNPEICNRLTSSDPDKKFSALVHTQGVLGQGYGFIADAFVLTNGTEPDRNDTEPPIPNQNYTYLINMQGNFFSTTGVAFSEICTLQYSLEMQAEAEAILPQVNAEIGTSLCQEMSSSVVSVRSASAPVTTDGTMGSTAIQFTLNTVLGEFGPPEIESCTADVDSYLMDHTNWGNPVLDPIPGCPGVQFTSNRFNDTGNEWVCQGMKLPNTAFTSHPVSIRNKASTWIYNIQHIGNFQSEDGSTIPSGCLTEHNSNFISSTNTAVTDVNRMLSNGELCELTTVQLILDSAILSGTGTTGLSYQQYQIDYPPDVDSAALSVCAGVVSEYLIDHSNWVLPILPPVSDCVDLEFEPQGFVENERGWFCVESQQGQAT